MGDSQIFTFGCGSSPGSWVRSAGFWTTTVLFAFLLVLGPIVATSYRREATKMQVRPVEVRGQLVPLGEQPLGPHRVTVQSARDTSSTITTNGAFELRVMSDEEALRIQVDASRGEDSAFHPALLRAQVDELTAGITILMIPFQWRIEKGRYAGDAVTISMHEALYAPETALPPYLDGEIRDELYRAAPARWNPENRPIPVAIRNATPDARSFTARDSAWVRAALNETEVVFGRDLFRQAETEDIDWPQLKTPPEGALGVIIDTVGGAHECTGGGYRRGQTVWELPPTLAKVWQNPPPAGYTEEGGHIRSALNIYCHHLFEERTQEAVISSIQHEVLHALGFGHGCGIPSHMAYRCEPQTDGIRTFDISPHDVAYWELRDAVFDAVQTHDARRGFLPALFGERVLVRDLRPIPSPQDWQTHALPVPPPPTDVTASVDRIRSGSPRVLLDWAGDIRIDSRSYEVYRATTPISGDPENHSPLDVLEAWSVSGRSAYVDDSVTEGEVYYYRITAFYADHPQESAFSKQVRVFVPHVATDSIDRAGTVNFEDAGVRVNLMDSIGVGEVRLAAFEEVSDGSPGAVEGSPQPYRIVLRPDSNLAGAMAEVRVQRSALGDVPEAGAVGVLRRTTPGKGSFERLKARYDYSTDALVFETPLSGEFAFAHRTETSVKVMHVRATAKNDQVMLRWQASTNRHGAGFEVQRKEVGAGEWQVLGMVEGEHPPSSGQSYVFSDADPALSADSLMYRLRILRSDDTASLAYSDSATVRSSNSPETDP